jgi:hypothetical protein
MFKRFFKWIVPLWQKHGQPLLESGVKAVGQTALNTIGDIAKDTASGRNFRESANDRINTAVQSLAERAEKTLEGKGLKRKKKKKFKKYIVLKKKTKLQDIFD